MVFLRNLIKNVICFCFFYFRSTDGTLYPSSFPRTFWASFHFTLTVLFITVVCTPSGASSGSERECKKLMVTMSFKLTQRYFKTTDVKAEGKYLNPYLSYYQKCSQLFRYLIVLLKWANNKKKKIRTVLSWVSNIYYWIWTFSQWVDSLHFDLKGCVCSCVVHEKRGACDVSGFPATVLPPGLTPWHLVLEILAVVKVFVHLLWS